MNEIGSNDETYQLRSPHVRTGGRLADRPARFHPLQLLLVPGGMLVDVTQPETVIGRHSSCELRLPSPDVSRQHCRLVFRSGQWWAEDCGSLNGLLVNDAYVESHPLVAGDRIQIGGSTLVVQPSSQRGSQGERLVIRSIAVALSPTDLRQAS